MSGTPPTTLLSLDPSCVNVGWAVIGSGPSYLASGVSRPLGMDADERIRSGVVEVVMGLINYYQPSGILIEMPDYIAENDRGRNSQNLIKFFRAVGATEAAAARFGRPIHYVKSSNMKAATAKEDRRQRFRALVGRPPQSTDESDALCLGWDFVVTSGVTFTPTSYPPL